MKVNQQQFGSDPEHWVDKVYNLLEQYFEYRHVF